MVRTIYVLKVQRKRVERNTPNSNSGNLLRTVASALTLFVTLL